MCTTLLWRKNTAVGLRDDWLRRSCHPIIAKLPKIGAKISIAVRINQSTSPCLKPAAGAAAGALATAVAMLVRWLRAWISGWFS